MKSLDTADIGLINFTPSGVWHYRILHGDHIHEVFVYYVRYRIGNTMVGGGRGHVYPANSWFEALIDGEWPAPLGHAKYASPDDALQAAVTCTLSGEAQCSIDQAGCGYKDTGGNNFNG